MASILFYTAWIVIRNADVKIAGADHGFVSLLKSFFIALSWGTCRVIFKLIMGDGILNPTLVIGTWFFDLIVYQHLKYRFSPTQDPENIYKMFNMGRWVWIYFMAELIAAPIAGLIAKNLLEVMNENKSKNDDDHQVQEYQNDTNMNPSYNNPSQATHVQPEVVKNSS